MFWEITVIYLVVIGIISMIITVADKFNSIRKKERVSEGLLMFTAAVGGALVMYITMNCINHKTRRNKFMIGLPMMFVVHIVVLMLVYIYF